VDAILARNELFASLPRDDLRALAEQAKRQLCPAGVPVVRAGDAGQSLFVLVEGLLSVLRRGDDGVEWPASTLVPGDAFGEFSLLTGERRSATVVPKGDAVVYEITKQDLEPILHRHRDLVRQLGWILAQRQMRQHVEGRPGHPANAGASPAAHVWLERVQAFFSLGRDPGPPPSRDPSPPQS
jgi:CRP-like cAMP-binding protein